MEGRGLKRGYSFISSDSPDYESECGGSVGTRHRKGVITNEPGSVAAVGGIPDELKINDGMTLWVPFPIWNPKDLPQDPTERHKALLEFSEKVIEQAFKQLRRISSICKQPMVEMNIPAPFPREPCESSLTPQTIPFRSNLNTQTLEESEEGGSVYTIESPSGSTFLARDLANVYFIEVTCYKGVLIKKPGYVAAVGGIPDELKINGGISFSLPCPIFKYPKEMPLDPTECERVVYEVYKEAMESDAYINAFVQAYIKARSQARGVSSSWIRKQEEEAHNIYQQRPTMLEFNIAASPGSKIFLRCLPSDPVLMKLEMEKSEWVKSGYSVCIVEPRPGIILLKRSFCNHVEVTHLMGVMINKPRFVAVVGGIPDELKIKGANSLWIPSPIFKYAKKRPGDPSGRQKAKCVLYDSPEVEMSCTEALERGYEKARVSSSSTCKQEAAHNIDQLIPMIELNVVESPGRGSSDEFSKDNTAET